MQREPEAMRWLPNRVQTGIEQDPTWDMTVAATSSGAGGPDNHGNPSTLGFGENLPVNFNPQDYTAIPEALAPRLS